MSTTKILLGGVPFGCNNIGDEAILERIVDIVRSVCPEADITVSTGDPINTAQLLSVKTCALHSGFSENEKDDISFLAALSTVDIFIWSGATGLSDYPDTSLSCLLAAQKRGLKTVVFCTGMNDTLNPAHFTLSNGLKLTLLTTLNKILASKIDFVRTYELRKECKLRQQLKVVLDNCDLVINRDEQSKAQLMRSNLETPPLVAADPAITLPLQAPNGTIWGDKMMSTLNTNAKLIGVCISSQQQITENMPFARWLDEISTHYDANIVFIPMNPITDFEAMADIRNKMFNKDKTIIAQGSTDPRAVAGLAEKMDVIISSRLHLLIFASISDTPCIGIGRGSKVSNFLSEFGFCTAGTTEKIKFDHLSKELEKLCNEKIIYQEVSRLVRLRMHARLNKGIEALSHIINPELSHNTATK